MADIIISIASEVAGYLVAPIGRQLCYLINYHSNVEDLKTQVEKLRDVKDRMINSVNAARRNGEEIEPDAERWLMSVSATTEKATEILLEDEDKAKMKCLNGLCPNLKSRYQLSKKAKKMVEEVIEIQDGEKFIGSGYEDFASRKSTLKEIMEALRNPNINMIGVYGMGGVGKTMLVKEAARKAMNDKLFDKVVMAVLSQHPNVRKIQEEIAYPLGLRFDDEEIEFERVERLGKRLNQEKSILIILDDVWVPFDLEVIGIPSGDIHNGCTIVVTSRRLDILSDMNTQNNFGIEQLFEEESWNLFKKMAGYSIEDPQIKPTALEVARKCAGLPLAITVLATALKNKSLDVWKDALYQLQTATSTTIEGMNAEVNSSLKLSYDFLESEAQKLFLLCSLHPKEYQFSIQDLLYYGKGVGLFRGIQTLETARDTVHALVNHLKASGLLLDGNTSGFFKMPVVVRDLGISVASKDKHMLIGRNKVDLEEWATEELRSCTALSLPYTDIHELPIGLESPQLKFFLFFSSLYGSSKIPDSFFEGMRQLKVLTLRNIDFSSLPSSLHFLSSLQTLCLNECKLPDISIIGELKKLEILTMRQSNIKELPREIGQLTRLRLLDLRDCTALEVIPRNVIASLSRLEELYLRESFNRWEVDGNASLAELEHLSRLLTLEIYLRHANILPNDLVFEKLTRYRLYIGNYFGHWSDDYEISRALYLAVNTSIHLLSGINKLLRRTEDLHLEELNGFKSIINDLDREGFLDLKSLHIKNNSEIEYVINTMSLTQVEVPFSAFLKLESFSLVNLINLKEICHGQLTVESFSNLRKVHVYHCEKLQNLFPLSVATRLLKLQEIQISRCKNMDGIVAEGREAAEDNNGAVYEIMFPLLRSLKLDYLPELVSFYSKVKAVPSTSNAGSKEIISNFEGEHGISRPFFNAKDTFPSLELWLSQLPDGSFCNLRKVEVINCDRLQNLFPVSMARRLSKLQKIKIRSCKNMDEIVAEGREAAEDNNGAVYKIMFPQLQSLTLYDLPKLVSFCSKVMAAHSTSNVGSKEIISISEGEHGISIPLFNEEVTFPNLEKMELNHMSSMEVIWQNQFHAHSFCKLRVLKVENCDKLLKVFPISLFRNLQNLKELSIEDCCSLEDVFELEGGFGETKHSQLSTVFQNLTTLQIRSCGSLTHVFPSTRAEGPVQIQSTTVASDKREATDETTFSQLDYLKLKDLPNLTSFCPGGNNFSFPSLEELSVIGCPKLKTFSSNKLRTPKLKKVQITDNWHMETNVWVWDGDLNATIQNLFKKKECKKEFGKFKTSLISEIMSIVAPLILQGRSIASEIINTLELAVTVCLLFTLLTLNSPQHGISHDISCAEESQSERGKNKTSQSSINTFELRCTILIS